MDAYELAEELETLLLQIGLKDNRIPKMLRQQADRIAELEKQLAEEEIYSGILEAMEKAKPQIKLNDEEIEKCVITWVKKIYGNEYVTPSDSHITQGTMLIRLAEQAISTLYTAPQTKPLSDEEMNKAFDYYCETDEGVLRFDYELRKEWKEKELQRWKEAFARAIKERHGIK